MSFMYFICVDDVDYVKQDFAIKTQDYHYLHLSVNYSTILMRLFANHSTGKSVKFTLSLS